MQSAKDPEIGMATSTLETLMTLSHESVCDVDNLDYSPRLTMLPMAQVF
jgi:hypothetical protein